MAKSRRSGKAENQAGESRQEKQVAEITVSKVLPKVMNVLAKNKVKFSLMGNASSNYVIYYDGHPALRLYPKFYPFSALTF